MRQFWLRRVEKYYQKNKWHIVADIAFLSLILILTLTLILIRVWRPQNLVEFKTDIISEKVTSGEITEFVIKYQAREDLSHNSISFNWPNNFIFESIDPSVNFNTETNTVLLNDLPEGANGEIKVRGRVLGAIGERQDIFFFFNCDVCPDGLVESLVYNIEASALKANWQLPELVYRGVEFKTKVELENTGDFDFKNITLTSVDGFKIISGFNTPLNLSPGEKREMELTLISDTVEAKANLRLQYFSQINNDQRLQGELSQEMTLAENRFKLILAPEDLVVKNGEEVVYNLSYENGNQESLDNLRFSFGSGLNSIRLISSEPKLEAVDGQSWKLKNTLNYNQGGQARFAVVFKDKNELEQKLSLMAVADYRLLDQELRYRVEAPIVKFFSRLSIKSGAYYYSPQGDQLGVGPIPPQVGRITNYWIFWEINNHGNALENFSLSAGLPEDVIWSGKKTIGAGTLRYNDVAQKLSWELNSISAESTPSEYYIGFEVSVLPTIDQLGKIIPLLDNIHYSTKDLFVGETMQGNLNDLSSNLDADLLGRGRGQVVESE